MLLSDLPLTCDFLGIQVCVRFFPAEIVHVRRSLRRHGGASTLQHQMESMAVSMLLAQTRLVPGTGTVLQGCLPTYQSGPAAGFVGLCLLVVLRLLQGMFTGGEIATVSTYITEVGNPRCCQEIKTFLFWFARYFICIVCSPARVTVHSSHSFTRTNPNS